jgi:hypothetical protein
MSTVTLIRYEYADGTVKQATGKDAESIDKWLTDCQWQAQNHGVTYSGPFMQTICEFSQPSAYEEITADWTVMDQDALIGAVCKLVDEVRGLKMVANDCTELLQMAIANRDRPDLSALHARLTVLIDQLEKK